MENELVRRRHWLSRERFLDLLGASNLIPGPAAVMVAALGWLYVHFGKLPATAGILYGIKPVVIAVIVQALWGLGRTAVKTTFLGFVAVFSLVLTVFGFHPLVLLLLAGGLACLPQLKTSHLSMSVFPSATMGSGSVAAATSFSLGWLFLVFLKMGAVVFGSGYVLLAFLRPDLVTHRSWLTEAQLVDAVAVGQVTPGPVFTTATFIGFILGGIPALSLLPSASFYLLLSSSRLAVRWCRASENPKPQALFLTVLVSHRSP